MSQLVHPVSERLVFFSHLGAMFNAQAKLWDSSGKLIRTFGEYPNGIRKAMFNPRGDQALTVARDGVARLWDASTGRLMHELPNPSGRGELDASFSPDGARAVTSATAHSIRLWNVNTGELLRELKSEVNDSGEQQEVSALFSSTGTRVLTTSYRDDGAWLWDAAEVRFMKLLQMNSYVTSGAFSPNGELIVTTALDRSAAIWDATSGELRCKLEGHEDCVMTAAFSPDGERIATGDQDGTVKLWETRTCVLLSTFVGHKNRVKLVTFNPNGESLITADERNDSSVLVWDVRLEQRPADEISKLLSQRTGWQISNGMLVPRERARQMN